VDIHINGRNLIEIIREVELPFAKQENHPNIAGSYQGLPARIIYLPSRHLLGEPQFLYSDDSGRTQLLQCTCGEPGCWPLLARVTIEPDRVVWDDFCQPHRGPNSRASHWKYDALPAFIFARSDYEAALVPTPGQPLVQ
jgi:hypothetical protein